MDQPVKADGDAAAAPQPAVPGVPGEPGKADAPVRQPTGTKPGVSGWAKKVMVTVGLMVVGAVIGFFVQKSISWTGLFGKTVETVAAEQKVNLDEILTQQKVNFDEIRAKLEAMGKAKPGSPEALRLQEDLKKLFDQQEKRANQTIQLYESQMAQLRAEALQTRGTESGADFWLKIGESMTIRHRGNVLSLLNNRGPGYGNFAVVNALGKEVTLKPGDSVEFPDGDNKCKVFFKQAAPRADGRIGFDLVLGEKPK